MNAVGPTPFMDSQFRSRRLGPRSNCPSIGTTGEADELLFQIFTFSLLILLIIEKCDSGVLLKGSESKSRHHAERNQRSPNY